VIKILIKLSFSSHSLCNSSIEMLFVFPFLICWLNFQLWIWICLVSVLKLFVYLCHFLWFVGVHGVIFTTL
jgi:cellobiose-specific phosphotransferase system component IIC